MANKKNKVVNKTRRNNGEGSIYQRSDGRWAGYVTIGYNENGSPKRKIVYGKNQTEVAQKLFEISGRIKNNTYDIIEKKSFGELMSEWLLVFKKSAVSPRTFEGIIRNYRLHIEPEIGNMKVYEVDAYAIQKLINILIEQDYSINVIKKNKHLISRFFEYAIDNKWASINPTTKIKVRARDRKIYDGSESYKALTPDVRVKFLQSLAKDDANFIKLLCLCLIFSGLRIGEALALKWGNIDFENKTIKVERSITQIPKFDEKGNVLSRLTVVGDTKTTCSVREIPIADIIVVEALQEWREKQILRQKTNPEVTADLIAKNSFIFANDDGSIRSYSGTRHIFNRFKREMAWQNIIFIFTGFAIHFQICFLK